MTSKWLRRAHLQQRKFEAWLERREIILARRIAAARNAMIRKVAAQYAMTGDLTLAYLEREHQERVAAILSASYRKVISERSQVTLDTIRSMKRIPNYSGYFGWIFHGFRFIHGR
jgi:hypothetical protein